MSERRSWDVQPNRRGQAPKLAPRRVEVDGVRPVKRAPQPAGRREPQRPPGERLRARRKRARRTGGIVTFIVLILALGALVYALWLPQLRIQSVAASGTQAEAIETHALAALGGTRGFILPRNSIFFFPKEALRLGILDAFPEVSALSISRASFTSLAIESTGRADAFVWCGVSIALPAPRCYETDAEGLIFREAGVSTTTVVLDTGSGTPNTAGDLRIFAPLENEVPEGGSPVGNHVQDSARVPDALRFVKAVRELGVPVSALELRGDEADLWLNGPTRITYVLGREEEAALLAASVIPEVTLTDGTVQYLDLRFKGKAYIKRYGE